MKILINTPRLIPHGGVANHYIGLKDYWKEEVLYNPIGKKSSKAGSGVYRLPINIISFIRKIFSFKPDMILLNPSLSKGAMTRDMIFLRTAKLFGKRVAVFIHGFNKDNIPNLNIKSITKDLNKCEAIFVLAQDFANTMRSWGVTVPIYLTTTKVDDRLLDNFSIETKDYSTKNILFLARVEEAKGIYTTLDAVKILQEKNPEITLRVAGSGNELEKAKEYARQNNIKADFLSTVSGEPLIKEFINANIYILPSHSEGMPTTVLEAMAFGLPVISRPVGGLCDFFENGKMGQLIESLDPQEYADAIDKYLNTPTLAKDTSAYNHEYAKEHFLASSVARQLEDILRKHIK